ncbi:MAG TPA: Ig-like domain-containing protein [Anaerolineales bacterium]|nr:Ig-like domain-containing protein [Anaerolineales bacterium]
MNTKRIFSLLLVFLLSLIPITSALAQEPELQLGLTRDFGYGGMGNDIQGLFSMKIKDPPGNLVRVVFLIDNETINEDSEAPFNYQFSTDNYPPGIHTLSASGYTTDGTELRSNEIRVEFLSAEDSQQAVGKILIPVAVVVLGAMLLSLVGPYLLGGGKLATLPLGEPRNYGLMGGAICPRCHRPFKIRALALNMVTHKLDRCPYCGKWGLHLQRSLNDLRAAEAAELQMAQPGQASAQPSQEDKLHKDLEDSRFQDS